MAHGRVIPGRRRIYLPGDGMKKQETQGHPALPAAVGALVLLLLGSVPAAEAVRRGLALCAGSVIPALFPFLTAVRFAVSCGLGQVLPGPAAALLLGAVGGYPMGAAAVGQLYETGQLRREDAQGLLCCCNNAGPAFILGYVGREVLGSPSGGLLLWGVHLASAAVMAALFFPRSSGGRLRDAAAPPPALGFVEAVRSSAVTMLEICGFVTVFSVVTGALQAAGAGSPLLLGALELTCGAALLPAGPEGFVMAAALLGWGGVSVHFQTAAVLSGTGLSLGRYLAAKAGQAALSAAIAAGVVLSGAV